MYHWNNLNKNSIKPDIVIQHSYQINIENIIVLLIKKRSRAHLDLSDRFIFNILLLCILSLILLICIFILITYFYLLVLKYFICVIIQLSKFYRTIETNPDSKFSMIGNWEYVFFCINATNPS